MRKSPKLYIDQYGTKFYAVNIKDLKRQIGRTKSKPMYIDRNGVSIKIGHVIGQHWLTAYEPCEVPVCP